MRTWIFFPHLLLTFFFQKQSFIHFQPHCFTRYICAILENSSFSPLDSVVFSSVETSS